MAQFDVFCPRDRRELLLDCQSNILDDLDTRFVVPLLNRAQLSRHVLRLNPYFHIDGDDYVMATQGAATIPVRMIGEHVTSLADHHDAIIGALDMLMTGY